MMKFTVTNDHLEFYKSNKWIEFEDLIDSNLCHELINDIPKNTKFTANHDLWRRKTSFDTVVKQRKFAKIVVELTGVYPLRLGFDHLFTCKSGLTMKSLYLNDWVPIQGLTCGLLLNLDCQAALQDKSTIPSKAGNGIFFSPEFPLEFPLPENGKASHFLLIAYVHGPAVFITNKSDELTMEFRKLGYQYGDRLLDSVNPVLYKA